MMLCYGRQQIDKTPYATLRPILIYDIDDPHNGYGLNRFRRLAASEEEIKLFGNGEERRDHIKVLMKNKYKTVSAIDLFCGAGGLTRGLEKAGVIVKLGVDSDPACEFPYVYNNSSEFLLKNIEDVKGNNLSKYFNKGEYKVLAGCAPCQTFSTYNQKAGKNDRRWWLLQEFSRLIHEVKPDIVTMENVPKLVNENIFKDFISCLNSESFHNSHNIINCADYGLPQHRNRLVLLASRHGPIKLLTKNEFRRKSKTVKDAIMHLPKLCAGHTCSTDPIHQSASLSDLNLKRIRNSKPGGTWRDWPDELIAECHNKSSGKTYPSVYGRMEWDKPSPTITTQFMGYGNGRFGHPKQHRAISLREGAILQGFPKYYKFVKKPDSIQKAILGRLIGNAVPIPIGELIGKSIINHLVTQIQ